MLRAEVRTAFTVVYRGYDIEVSRGPTGWRAGVYPRMIAKVRSHSPVFGLRQFSHNPAKPKGEPSFIAMA